MSTQGRTTRLFVNAIIALAVLCFKPARLTTAESDHHLIGRVLKASYVEQVLILRNFYQDSKLEYDSGGNLKGGGQSGDWTVYGPVAIRDFKLRKD